jgi:transposase
MACKIKSKLHYFGYITADNDLKMSEKFITWINSLGLPRELQKSLDIFIESWRVFNRQLVDLQVDLQTQAFEDPESEEVYRSVPGVGLVSARVLANELGDLSKRFKNQDAVYQYTGLTPSEYSSGEHVRKGHIDRQGSSRVRHILIEVAWRAVKIDKALQQSFVRIAYRRGKTRAIVAIARKLIGRMRACFVHHTPYELNLVE